jgi:hypothetical protein
VFSPPTSVHTFWVGAPMPVTVLSVITEDFGGLRPMPIPQPQDGGIRDALRCWAELDNEARVTAALTITERQSLALLGYSERQASLAVREKREEPVFLGLLALGLDDWRFDYRDNLVRVALHYDAALRLGISPEDLFERAAAILPATSSRGLQSFLQRGAETRSLKAMGWRAGTDHGGFRYEWGIT